MAVKPISAPVVIRRNFGASTTTIRETVLDLGIRPAQSELAQLLKITLSKEVVISFPTAIASAQDNIIARQEWAFSTELGRTTIPDNEFESGCFYKTMDQISFVATAAVTAALTRASYGRGNPTGVEVYNPPIILAANSIALYDIATDADAKGAFAPFGIEFMYQLVQVDSATLAALLARGDLFL